MVTTTNREYSDEMPYEAKSIFREEMHFFFGGGGGELYL